MYNIYSKLPGSQLSASYVKLSYGSFFWNFLEVTRKLTVCHCYHTMTMAPRLILPTWPNPIWSVDAWENALNYTVSGRGEYKTENQQALIVNPCHKKYALVTVVFNPPKESRTNMKYMKLMLFVFADFDLCLSPMTFHLQFQQGSFIHSCESSYQVLGSSTLFFFSVMSTSQSVTYTHHLHPID